MDLMLTLDQALGACDRIVGLREGKVIFDHPLVDRNAAVACKLPDVVTSPKGEVECNDIEVLNAVWRQAMRDAGV
ncbi:hypothetical protein GCM10017056_19770 [Seohaeicola zhoushanensis]|uniref:Uncharacterized protein n=2 Tax=Seohaeicola zhoushanensis TaxID=1569283 RepID=A0A8J3GWC8_9RHOB|nr:hypothetical protein GCM10017056_19770 [Seohaeicola zhoushanensis]